MSKTSFLFFAPHDDANAIPGAKRYSGITPLALESIAANAD
ncbi:Hypothetical protein ABZS17G119_03156 [Kosakonia cowanii]|jgi:hypothetical protein